MKRKYLKGLMALALSGCFIFSQSVGVLISYAATDENGNEYVEVNETNFPDTIFRNYVTSNIDIDRDGKLTQGEIADAKRLVLNDTTEPIYSFQGIEYLTGLKKLVLHESMAETLDLSNATELEELNVSDNKLKSLDLSHNLKLKTVNCNHNAITELDTSMLGFLKELSCSYNQLTSLKVNTDVFMTKLDCKYNKLTEISFSGYTLDANNNELTKVEIVQKDNFLALHVDNNKLTELDITQYPNLGYLFCSNNNLSTLDISQCPDMETLTCSNNNISILDIAKCKNLGVIECSDNPISSLDTSNSRQLKELKIRNTNISSLDLSNTFSLKKIECSGSKITELDIRNTEMNAMIVSDPSMNPLSNFIKGEDSIKVTYMGTTGLVTVTLANPQPSYIWKSDASGWWVEDSNGSFPKNQWLQIDGKWYFFTSSGYMDYAEYRDGCWLNADGSWDTNYSKGTWHQDGTGWWYEDNGWYPSNQYLWIDGVKYWFDSTGYMK